MVSRYRGPLRAYQVADSRYPLFDGSGAAEFGSRWNSPGRRVVYGALSYAGALLERLTQTGIGKAPRRQYWITIDVSASVEIEEITSVDVPGWDAPDLTASRAYGDLWVAERRSVALIVPSVVGRPHERNLMINQDHPEFRHVTHSDLHQVLWDPQVGSAEWIESEGLE